MKQQLKILLLVNHFTDGPQTRPGKTLKKEDWLPDKNVMDALIRLGHQVLIWGVHSRIRPLVTRIRRMQPDLIFNLVECFDDHRFHEAHLAGLLELLQLPYTGSRPPCLHLCRNKFFTKRILSPHKIKVPRAVVFPRKHARVSFKHLRFPLFVKPLGEEASDGIVQNSFTETPEECLERVRFIQNNLKMSVIVEEYIEGREIYAGILGTRRLTCLPLREMFFSDFPDSRPRFATFKAKWDVKFRKRWNIRNSFAAPLTPEVERKIWRISKTAYRALGVHGYGRLDLRVTPEGEIYVIEVNPNPSLAQDDELAQSAKKFGISYDAMIARVIRQTFIDRKYYGRTSPIA